MSTYLEYGGFVTEKGSGRDRLIFKTAKSEEICRKETMKLLDQLIREGFECDPKTLKILFRVVEYIEYTWTDSVEKAWNKRKEDWTPVEEKKPEIQKDMAGSDDLLLTISYGRKENGSTVCTGYLSTNGKWYTYRECDCGAVGEGPMQEGDTVTAWQPCPKSYLQRI